MRALGNIYRRKFNASTEIEPLLYGAVSGVFRQAADEGFQSSTAADPDRDFHEQLRHSADVFSAFKVHRAQNDMAARLLDSNGVLKPFNQWLKEVMPIASHQCGAWLKTEYDTAVIRAHQAADWQQFWREADVLPNLRWMPSTSVHPGEDHRRYWGTIRPIEDDFWNHHRPGDRWNCKCSLSNTDDAPTPLPEEEKGRDAAASAPHPGLKGNPGTTAELFSQDHPYYPKSCKNCDFYNPGLKDQLVHFFNVRKKDCYHCPYIDAKLKKIKTLNAKPPKVETYKEVYMGMVFTSPYHGENEKEENERLAKFVTDKLKSKVYLLPRLDPKNAVEKALRSTLLPPGVFENKNPDFYIGGKIYDGKSMLKVRKTNDKKKHHNDILNRIKSAKEQADNIILEIPTFISRRTISQTVNGYLQQSKKERIIIVKHGNKCYVYN